MAKNRLIAIILVVCIVIGSGIGIGIWLSNRVDRPTTGISVRLGSIQTTIYQGTIPNTEGLQINAYTSAGYRVVTRPNLEVTPIDTTTLGPQTIHVIYDGQSTTFTVNVVARPQNWQLVSYDLAPSFEAFKFNAGRISRLDDNQNTIWTEFLQSEREISINHVPYVVGHMNPFRFVPSMDVETPAGDRPVLTSLHVATVERNGNTLTAGTPLANGHVPFGNYVTFDPIRSWFQFSEQAIGHDFLLNVQPASSVNVHSSIVGSYIEWEVNVQDGWNAYSLEDLSHINNTMRSAWFWETYRAVRSNNPAFTSDEDATPLWDDHAFRALFLHNNITLGAQWSAVEEINRLPARFFDNYGRSGVNTGHLWNEAAIFDRITPIIGAAEEKGVPLSQAEIDDGVAINDGRSFSFNGNFFHIDVTRDEFLVRPNSNFGIPINGFGPYGRDFIVPNHVAGEVIEIGTIDGGNPYAATVLFSFGGNPFGRFNELYAEHMLYDNDTFSIRNFSAVGNSQRTDDANPTERFGLIFMVYGGQNVTIENTITSSFVSSFIPFVGSDDIRGGWSGEFVNRQGTVIATVRLENDVQVVRQGTAANGTIMPRQAVTPDNTGRGIIGLTQGSDVDQVGAFFKDEFIGTYRSRLIDNIARNAYSSLIDARGGGGNVEIIRGIYTDSGGPAIYTRVNGAPNNRAPNIIVRNAEVASNVTLRESWFNIMGRQLPGGDQLVPQLIQLVEDGINANYIERVFGTATPSGRTLINPATNAFNLVSLSRNDGGGMMDVALRANITFEFDGQPIYNASSTGPNARQIWQMTNTPNIPPLIIGAENQFLALNPAGQPLINAGLATAMGGNMGNNIVGRDVNAIRDNEFITVLLPQTATTWLMITLQVFDV